MIAVVNYGLGNLRSVAKALEIKGAGVEVTSSPSKLQSAEAIVLPGVGAFSRGIENLKKLKILDVIIKEIYKGKPFLGICLGLQLLFTQSEEHTLTGGMNVIEGKVVKFPSKVKIPHMGWNQVEINNQNSKSQIFDGIPNNSYFYFVHSYYVVPEDSYIIAATTVYGERFVSAIVKDNLFGVQFHPEKSGEQGLKILENFIKVIN